MQILNYRKYKQIHPSTGIERAILSGKNNLEGVSQCRLAPFVQKKDAQLGYYPVLGNHVTKHHDSNKIYTDRERYIRTEKSCKNAPPPTNTDVTDNVTKNHNLDGSHTFRRGQEVAITTQRQDRQHFNGCVGTVAAVIYPSDPSRSIVYVRVQKASPCFFAYELNLVAKAEEVAA